MAKDVFVAPGGDLFVQSGAAWLQGEEQDAIFCKCLQLLRGELLLSRDSLGAYVDDAMLFVSTRRSTSRSWELVKVEMSGMSW